MRGVVKRGMFFFDKKKKGNAGTWAAWLSSKCQCLAWNFDCKGLVNFFFPLFNFENFWCYIPNKVGYYLFIYFAKTLSKCQELVVSSVFWSCINRVWHVMILQAEAKKAGSCFNWISWVPWREGNKKFGGNWEESCNAPEMAASGVWIIGFRRRWSRQ